MKTKLLATALTVSLPLVFGGAYAQTTTTAESGNNRSANGTSTAPNQSPSGTADRNQAGGSTGAAGSAASGSSNTGAAGSAAGATGTGTTGAAGSGAAGTGAAGTGATGAGTGTSGSGGMGSSSNGTGTGATGGSGAGAAGTGAGAAGAGAAGANSATAPGMESRGDAAASTEAITGWSAKDDIIGKSVVNENDEKIGDINDIVISSDGRSMYLLIGAGGFLGMGSKDVAVPFDRFERNEDRILLSGYTKEQLKALPEVETRR